MTGRPRKLSPAAERMLVRKYRLGRRLTPRALQAKYGLSGSTFRAIVGRKGDPAVERERYLRRKVREYLEAAQP